MGAVSMEKKDLNSSFIFPLEKLEVWQLAVELADYIFGILDEIPANSHLRLVSQMEVAVSGVAQNVAEGKGRQYIKEFIQFLYIAEGCLFEVLTLTGLFRRRKLIRDDQKLIVWKKAEIFDRKLHGLIKSLKRRS
jgi:four helix bundle protein